MRRYEVVGVHQFLENCSIINEVGVCVTTTPNEVGECVTTTTPSLSLSDISMVYEALLVAMNDYTSDSRGDIGAL